MNLAYASEAEGTIDRLWRVERKLETKLRPDGGKPKWMRWRTYERISDRITSIGDARADVYFAQCKRHW